MKTPSTFLPPEAHSAMANMLWDVLGVAVIGFVVVVVVNLLVKKKLKY